MFSALPLPCQWSSYDSSWQEGHGDKFTTMDLGVQLMAGTQLALGESVLMNKPATLHATFQAPCRCWIEDRFLNKIHLFKKFTYNIIKLQTDRILISPKPENQHLLCSAFYCLVYLFLASQLGQEEAHLEIIQTLIPTINAETKMQCLNMVQIKCISPS